MTETSQMQIEQERDDHAVDEFAAAMKEKMAALERLKDLALADSHNRAPGFILEDAHDVRQGLRAQLYADKAIDRVLEWAEHQIGGVRDAHSLPDGTIEPPAVRQEVEEMEAAIAQAKFAMHERRASNENALPSQQTLEIAFRKWQAGYRPGDELWSDYDQTAAYYLTAHLPARDTSEPVDSEPSEAQCPNCGGSQPCIREDCQGAHERND